MATFAAQTAAMVTRLIARFGEAVTLRGQAVISVNSRTTAATPTDTDYPVTALRGRGSWREGSGARAESCLFTVLLADVGATPTTAWLVVDSAAVKWRVVEVTLRCSGAVADLQCQKGK